MRALARRPRAGLAVVPVLLLLLGLTAGCGSDDDTEPSAGATSSAATGASEEPSDPSGAPTDAPTDPESLAAELPAEVREVCGPYLAMVAALQDIDYSSGDTGSMAAEMAPLMKEWAAVVPSLQRPEGMSEEAWSGIMTLAERVADLPDRPTVEDLERVEKGLTAQQRKALDAAGEWLRQTCVAG